MEWLLLAAGILLVLGTGFFVSVEFSLVALDHATVQRSVDRGEAGAKALMQCVTTLSTQLSSCQLGITLTTLLTGFVVEPSVGKLLEGPLSALGVPGVHAVALTVACVAPGIPARACYLTARCYRPAAVIVTVSYSHRPGRFRPVR